MTSRFSDLLNTFIAFNLQNIYVFIKINLLKFTVSSVSQLFFILKENLSPHDSLLVYMMISTFTVVKSKALQSSLPLANAFVTVGLLPVPAGAPVKNPQTSTIVCSNSPSFNQLLNLWVHSGYGRIYLVPLASRQDQLELKKVVSCIHLKLKFMKTIEIVCAWKTIEKFFFILSGW